MPGRHAPRGAPATRKRPFASCVMDGASRTGAQSEGTFSSDWGDQTAKPAFVAKNTLPLGSSAAECRKRLCLTRPAWTHCPLVWSHSASSHTCRLSISRPPLSSTSPFGSTVNLCSPIRPCGKLPVALHCPVLGSHNNAEAATAARSLSLLLHPPTRSTRPSGSNAATWPSRTVGSGASVRQWLWATSYNSTVSSHSPLAPLPPATNTSPEASRVAV